jgi:ABC-2 type transport system permease protein
MIGHHLRLEVVRMLRDPRFTALGVLTPIGFYLLFATLFGGQPAQPGELKGTVEIMVAMAAYGGIWAVLSSTAPRIAQERESGWLTQVRAMPVRAGQLMAAKVLASVLLALPTIVLVCITAALCKGVRLEAGQWIGMVLVMTVGTVPFSALGVFLGYLVSADAAFPLSYGLYMGLSAVGGLWVPPAVLPQSFRDVAGWLPSNRLADLGWRIAAHQTVPLATITILAGWTLLLAVAAVLAYRRPHLRLRAAPAGTAEADPAVRTMPT